MMSGLSTWRKYELAHTHNTASCHPFVEVQVGSGEGINLIDANLDKFCFVSLSAYSPGPRAHDDVISIHHALLIGPGPTPEQICV